MLQYNISQSNSYTFRTEVTASSEFTMSMEDMYTLQTITASMSDITYEPYESYIGFTASISGAIVGGEYRLKLYNSGSTQPIWHGSMQVYASQSIDKSVYENQNTQYTSHVSENRYVILD